MDIFNNREISVAIWVAILGVWVLTRSTVRQSFSDIIKVFCHKTILTIFALMATYIGLLVYALYQVGLWDLGQLKNTIIWSVAVAAVSLVGSYEISDDPDFYRNAIKRNLKLVVVLEFIIAFHTFDFWIEFLIVPITAVAAATLVIAQTKEEYEPAEKFLNNFLALIGGCLIIYAVYNLYMDFGLFAKTQTLTDFILPPILSLLFLPFLFIISLYSSYENAFIRLQFFLHDPALRTFAKQRAIIGFHVHTGLLKRWTRNLNVLRPENRRQIKESICEVKTLWKRERNPDDVPIERGWSPYTAANYLKEDGFCPDDYHRAFDGDEWVATSPNIKKEDGSSLNSISYYIEGDEFTATNLKLIMDNFDPKSSEQFHQKFVCIARLLFKKALHGEMPEEIESHLSPATDITVCLLKKKVSVAKTEWSDDHFGGYMLKFEIQNDTDC